MEKKDFIIVVVRGTTLASNIVLRLDKATGDTHKLYINPANSQEVKWIKVKE